MRQRRLISTGVAGLLCGLAALAALALGAPKPDKPGNGPPSNPPVGSGQVEIGLSQSSNMLDLANAAIGDTKSGSVVVSNAGKLAADFSLVGDLHVPSGAQGVTALTNQLQLVVTKSQTGSPTTQLYSGSVSGFNAAGGFALGVLYPTQGSRTPKNLTLNFQLSFPTTGTNAGDNALQNLGPIDQQFRVEAAQQTGASTNNGNGNSNSNDSPASGGNTTGQTTATGAPALTPTQQLAPATQPAKGPKTVKRIGTDGAGKKATHTKKRKKRARTGKKVRVKSAASKEGPGFARRNAAALGLMAVAAALLLTLTLPAPTRGRP